MFLDPHKNTTAKPTKIVVSGDDDVPLTIYSITNGNALAALHFVRGLIDAIGLEQLAQREGWSFDHPFAESLGAFPVDVARHLAAGSNQRAAPAGFSVESAHLGELRTTAFEVLELPLVAPQQAPRPDRE